MRASGQFLLHKTSYLPAQHIVYDEQHHRIFGKVEENFRRRIERIGKVLPECIDLGDILIGLKQVRIRYKRFLGI